MLRKLQNLLFVNQSVRQTIVKNAFWLSFGEVLGRVLRTGVVIYAARVLGPATWGVFSYAVSLAALLTIFSEVGLGGVLIREGAKSEALRMKYFSTIFFVKLPLALLSFFSILLLAPHIATVPLSRALILAIAFLSLFDSMRGFGTALFRAEEKMEREAAVNIVTQGVILIAGLFVLLRSPSPEALASAYMIGAAAGLLVATIWLGRHLGALFSHFDKSILISILRTAWPFSIVGVLAAITVNTDTIMLGWLRDAAEVGYYSAAQKPILFLYILPSLLGGSFFPALARFAANDALRFRMVLEKGLKVVFFVALPAAAGLFFTSSATTELLYGPEYAPAAAPLQILALTLLTAFPMNLVVNGIFAYNRQRDLILFGAVGVLGNIILNYLFIPHWGASGAAWSTLITQFISNGFIWMRLRALNRFSVFRSLRKVLIATIAVGLVAALAQSAGMPVALVVALAALTYGATLLLLREELFIELKRILKE